MHTGICAGPCTGSFASSASTAASAPLHRHFVGLTSAAGKGVPAYSMSCVARTIFTSNPRPAESLLNERNRLGKDCYERDTGGEVEAHGASYHDDRTNRETLPQLPSRYAMMAGHLLRVSADSQKYANICAIPRVLPSRTNPQLR